jgi:glycerophosphoryl diester phosphodiesterase
MTLVIAHRGASARFRENTVEAFQGAEEMGADWVELDVRRTGDGALVVHHDPSIGGVDIISMAAADLPAHVASFEAALEACGNMGVNIEIKNDPNEPDYDDEHEIVGPVLEVSRRMVPLERLLYTSFDMGAVNRVHDLDRRVATGFITMDRVGIEVSVGRASAHNQNSINPADELLSPRFVAVAHEAELLVYPWTVDDPDRMAELIEMGVDGIITNTPDVLREIVG